MPTAYKILPLCLVVLVTCWHSLMTAASPAIEAKASYSGSQSCAGCHSLEYQEWQQSHHWHAMQPASEDSVLGDFNHSEFTYNGITSQFYRRDGKYFVRTDNASGELQEFEITYTFGIEPLQQYLIDFPDGRKQVLAINWDSRPKSAGGQRWYHLYPEHEVLQHGASQPEPITHEDALHWTGAYFNWNSRCASCHSTELTKNYLVESDSYDTRWQEINVGCEACHGQGAKHEAWANSLPQPHLPGYGFDISLANKSIWTANLAAPKDKADPHKGSKQKTSNTLSRTGPSAGKQITVCASCHSRRTELQQRDVRKDYNDVHSLHLLESPQYFSDGQISDEVYVYGSFLQSKMYAAGVTCSNCHNPHSLELKIGKPGNSNGLCSQCHQPSYYDTKKHHHHETQSPGAQCVSCHMPTQTYMGVDIRHDHSFRIPRPHLSETTSVPNACTQCHQDKNNDWAKRSVDEWLKALGKRPSAHSFAATFDRIQQRDPTAAPDLMAIAQHKQNPGIVRATAALMHDGYYQHTDIEKLKMLLADQDPLVRAAAARSTQAMPANYRFSLLSARLDEPVMAVRVELAQRLADIPLNEIPPREAKLIEGLYQDFLSSTSFTEDFPESQVARGLFYMARGDYKLAETSYQHALKLSANHMPALLNYADLFRGLGRDSEGEILLKQAIAAQPSSTHAHFSLGLLYVRQGQLEQARQALKQATHLQADDPRYAYTYALILERLNETPKAIAFLQHWKNTYPANIDVDGVLNDLKKQPQ